ncbi:integrin alpha-3-like isoform X2 [Takifugu rubripes]|uniref:integrin alpha-3-like isoform X2 n=1 Tax=Takifugu rubripes TaxID=31033 RepID=UPI001145823B|nr:integrin alpha-3-like isoform X2 [Takifugu rubripes]
MTERKKQVESEGGFSDVSRAKRRKQKGEKESLFGLSVALHHHLKTGTYLLLVGAPREWAEHNVPANRTGGLYSCSITVDQSDCSRIKLVDPDLNPSEDLVEDMWLGVSVASQGYPGGRVLACGHRFVKLYGAFKLRHMIGRCYLRGNDLQYDDADMNWQTLDEPCSHLGDVTSEVMCNMGISATITQTEVIVGSPGSYEWQGNVHVSWMNPHVLFDTERSSFNNLQRRNIYIGYSVAQTGRLLSQEQETIVTGAPRDSKDDARGSVLLIEKRAGKLVIRQTLRGEQIGSYFGNVVATTDLNNDGWEDLLVGAPFYFHHEEKVGGAVYIYMNTGGGFDSGSSMVLTGPAGSAFGMSVAAAGDLNQDGFQDFAVGAPFHETGTVMIWTSGSEGVSREPSQVIHGRAVSHRFTTFGYSLSGGHDVDGNKYPDLLVGSLDHTVALLRTRPVLHLTKTLRVWPDIVDPNNCDFCIQVEVCFSYTFTSRETSDNDNITIHFIVIADVTSLEPRLHFHSNRQSTFSGFLSMPKNQCRTLNVGLKSPVLDRVRPLMFSLNVSLYENIPEKRDTVQDLRHLPVLNNIPKPIRTQIHIQKACGSDNYCHSNLQMRAHFTDDHQRPLPTQNNSQILSINGSIDQLYLEVNISNSPTQGQPAEDAHNSLLNISIPAMFRFSGVRTKKLKSAEPEPVQCSVEGDSLLCELGNPFRSNQEVQVLIRFQPNEINLDIREIQTVIQLSTLSEQADVSPVFISMLVKISLQASLTLVGAPGHASFSGHVTGESAIKGTEDVGGLLVFTLQVHIHGKRLGHHDNLQVLFDWPKEVSNGKWLLYLTEIQINGTSNSGCFPPGNVINPLNLMLSEENRKRRSLGEQGSDGEAPSPLLHLLNQRKSYTLDCSHGAKCVTFVCPLINMRNSAILTVKARLWNSTMIEDYSDARTVMIGGRATLMLQNNRTINMDSDSTAIEVLVYPEAGQGLDASVPLWILVLSILTGVLLLAGICFLLWKCGFFVHEREWRAAAIHQGRIVGRANQLTEANGDGTSSFRTQKTPKHWVSSWAEKE